VSSYQIGTLAGGTAGMSSLDSVIGARYAPKGEYRAGQQIRLGSLGARSVGAASAFWRWPSGCPKAVRDALRAYCTGASAEVYLTTRTNETDEANSEFATFRAILIWPGEEPRDFLGWRLDFALEFVLLETVEVA
jgi:hypothetical protein